MSLVDSKYSSMNCSESTAELPCSGAANTLANGRPAKNYTGLEENEKNGSPDDIILKFKSHQRII